LGRATTGASGSGRASRRSSSSDSCSSTPFGTISIFSGGAPSAICFMRLASDSVMMWRACT
jgi:hypothetical protein